MSNGCGAGTGSRSRSPCWFAHPDDETVGLGSRLRDFENLRLIHLTDGAPLSPKDRERAGFPSREAYAAERAEELENALSVLGACPRRIGYGVPDQQAIFELQATVGRLTRDLAGITAVITHSFEAGHPDHDAAALAVALACRRLGDAAPLRLEFAGYHLGPQQPVFGRFRDDPDAPETELPLGSTALAQKRQAVACFATQAQTLAQFPLTPERVRPAPDYRFDEPPGPAMWETWGIAPSQQDWQEAAREVLKSCA